MPFQIFTSDYFSSKWYMFLMNKDTDTEKNKSEEYKTLGTFSQGTNWEKIFGLGDQINRNLKMTEQQVIDVVTTFRKQKRSP